MQNNSYWDIDDALMSQELIKCKCNTDDCNFLSILKIDKDDDTQFLEGEEIQLPISLASILGENSYIDIMKPKFLSDEYYKILNSDPEIPDFSKDNKYFYEKCILLTPYIIDYDDMKWFKCLSRTSYIRFYHFFINSHNVKLLNSITEKKLSIRELKFFNKMVLVDKNNRYYKINYSNNNKILDEKIEARKNRHKMKKETENISINVNN